MPHSYQMKRNLLTMQVNQASSEIFLCSCFYFQTDINYQLLELDDGSQAIITLYKIKNETPKEEPPKKVKRFQCNYEGCEKVYATSYHLTVLQLDESFMVLFFFLI
jgi:hypothetical protein